MDERENDIFWTAVRERNKNFDGRFVFAVASTGIFCRPGCPGRTPRRENVRFYPDCEAAAEAGFRPCLRCRPTEAASADVASLCEYIREHLDERLSLTKLSEVSGLSPFHLQRKFKEALGITPRQFVEQERLGLFKSAVRTGSSVTSAVYDAGFGSASRVYERTDSHLGMTPKAYRNGGAAQTIHYAMQDTPLGLLLIAATERGICRIRFGESEMELVDSLREEFPRASLAGGEPMLRPHMEEVSKWLVGQTIALDLPLDVRATAFQRRVWDYLQRIPYGTTRTYSDIAADLGQPSATRAVARACATNPVALAVPCHRVVRRDGDLAGYRWGVDRKQSLLAMEREHAQSSSVNAD